MTLNGLETMLHVLLCTKEKIIQWKKMKLEKCYGFIKDLAVWELVRWPLIQAFQLETHLGPMV